MEVEMRRRKWRWIRHMLMKPSQCITRRSLVWNPQGRRARGRPRMTWRRETEAEMASAQKTWKKTGSDSTRSDDVEDLCWRPVLPGELRSEEETIN
ncbi:hypothetical protein ElyMa_001919900 [Elysia marginata]|uniref:Uncharacterized protein n=1 Tax=Elysia marginata TaxID=1093978 RepID=A0AAV4ET37_9GAST|nr:hypothetical protein ElyMa_001919900 [Elysia marginata]